MSFPQTTPARPVPGAFLNTPAVASRFQNTQDPVRRQLFPVSEGSGQTSNSNLAARSLSSPSLALQSAGTGAAQGESALVGTNPLVAPLPRIENAPPIVKAAKAINAFLQSDEHFPDLDSYCRRKMMS